MVIDAGEPRNAPAAHSHGYLTRDGAGPLELLRMGRLRDRAVGVLATGPGAVMQALMWRQWSADVTLFQHTGPPASAEQERQLNRRGVPIVPGEVANVEISKDRLTGVRLVSGRVVPREVVVVGPCFETRHELLDPLGVEAIEHPLGIGCQVKADPAGFTGVPGVWVAGNVVDVTAGVMQSAASGVSVGAAINADLILADTTE